MISKGLRQARKDSKRRACFGPIFSWSKYGSERYVRLIAFRYAVPWQKEVRGFMLTLHLVDRAIVGLYHDRSGSNYQGLWIGVFPFAFRGMLWNGGYWR